ncbi:hypothetical protein N9933_00935 [bacterium]|nr:hypothetical protein [bacterium]
MSVQNLALIASAARNGVIPEFLSTRKNIWNLYVASWLDLPPRKLTGYSQRLAFTDPTPATDSAYIADFKHKVEFLLGVIFYANENEMLNGSKKIAYVLFSIVSISNNSLNFSMSAVTIF